MGKLFIWAVVILGVMLITRLLSHHNAKAKQPKPAKPVKQAPRQNGFSNPFTHAGEAEPMVRCDYCGIHLPRSEALLSKGKTWCCPDHARLGTERK